MANVLLSCLVLISLVACADDQTADVRSGHAADGGMLAPMSDKTKTNADTSEPTHPAWVEVVCANEQPLPLTVIPEPIPKGPGVLLFRQVDSACDRDEPTQIVAYNDSAQPIHIMALGTDHPRFSVVSPSAPLVLPPGDLLPIAIGFDAEVGDFEVNVIVSAAEGCTRVPVSATAVASKTAGLALTRPYVLSFGHVAAGTLSEPVELVVISQPKLGDPPDKISGFGASPGSFRVQPQTKSALDAAACEGAKTSVRFMAPDKPGLVRGQLTWSLSGGGFNASILTDLVAVVD